MADLSELNSGKKMSGCYSCMSCNLAVSEAVYDIQKKKLAWVCPECNHRSEIDFYI